MASRLELWRVERLVPYARNARIHSEEQIQQIAASIQEFGFTNPILVDGKDGVIAGHGRLEAARELGLSEVPVVVLDHLSPAQKRAYVLADNQLTLNGDWNTSVLQEELAALSLADFDLGLIGFDEKELASLMDPEDIDEPETNVGGGDEDVEPCPTCGR